jgi:hypothetical protein
MYIFPENFVLTAGHCVTSRVRKPTVIRLNDIDLGKDISTDLTVGILETKPHPNYNPTQQYDDIALIRLAKDLTFGISLFPSCLWSGPIEPEMTTTAIGFGIMEGTDYTDFG